MKYENFVGIDYSISSPGITIFTGNEEIHPSSCKYFFFNSLKKLTFGGIIENVYELKYPQYSNQISKFCELSNIVLCVLKEQDLIANKTLIAIEGYATGAKGKVFHIGENTGILKGKLWENGYHIVSEEFTSPKTIKKFATGNGNSKKKDMYEAYLKDGGLDIKNLLTPKKDIEKSFVADIIDSYYLCKFAQHYSKK